MNELETDFRKKLTALIFQYKMCRDEVEKSKIKERIDLLKKEYRLQSFKQSSINHGIHL